MNISQIQMALNRGRGLTIDESGKISLENRWQRLVRIIFKREDVVVNIAKVCNNIIDKCQNPKFFETLKTRLSKIKSPEAQKVLTQLSLGILGIKYRNNNEVGALDPQLFTWAQNWKNSEKYKEKVLTPKETEKLNELAKYPEFVELLKANPILENDKSLQKVFFTWALRRGNSVDIFVKFPATAKMLNDHLLSSRSVDLQIKGNDLTAPFEIQDGNALKSERFSILDRSQIINTRRNYKRTIQQIFAEFKNKNSICGDFEYFRGKGFTNFNVQKIASWDPTEEKYIRIDLLQENYWEQLPQDIILNKAQLIESLGLKAIENNEWIAIVRSTTENELDFNNAHGFLGVAIPDGKGNWKIYDFGKYATFFPSTFLQRIMVIANTVKGRIVCKDDNVFYDQRIQAKAPHKLSEEQGQKLMRIIAKDIAKGRRNQIIFQLAWENCAYWPQNVMERLLGPQCPNYFKACAMLATPNDPPMKGIFNWLKKKGKAIQRVFFKALAFILGGYRGRKTNKGFKSVFKSPFFKELKLYQPAFLHKQIIDKNIPGVITYGFLNPPSV